MKTYSTIYEMNWLIYLSYLKGVEVVDDQEEVEDGHVEGVVVV